MINFLKRVSIFLFVIICLYLLEGACFRLVDGYANWRLKLAWGKVESPSLNTILKSIPLDHYAFRPTDSDKPKHLGYWINEEDVYTSKIMSFTRPMRDNYKNYIINKKDTLNNYEIRDYGEIRGLVLPGLKRAASLDDVQSKKARRVGDKMEFARGVFLKVILNKDLYKQEFADLESCFGFLLEKGFACGVLPILSANDLLSKIDKFKTEQSVLSENLYVWADAESGGLVQEACSIKPDYWRALMITDPDQFLQPPTQSILPWVFFQLEKSRIHNEVGLDNLYNWIFRARSTNHLYSSRLGGLVRTSETFYVGKEIPSIFVAFILENVKFVEHLRNKGFEHQVVTFAQPEDQKINEAEPISLTTFANDEDSPPDFDLQKIEESIEDLSAGDSATNLEPADFNCEIISAYRSLNAEDKMLKKISNRDLILKLGLSFEQMGSHVLEQVRQKDPLFHRYYMSLQAIQDSPLN